jgi:DNA-binding transcriptional MerR regulator
MLRYYEAERLLRPARTRSGYRVYGEADVATVRRITMLNSAGLTLATIRALLPCARPGLASFRPCPAFKDSVRRRLADLERQIAALSESHRLLRGYLAQPDEDARRRTTGSALPRPACGERGGVRGRRGES